MKIRYLFTILTIILLAVNSFPQQELFIPRNIQQAYDKRTRSYDGNPGAEYWQNSSEYKIDVEVDPYSYTVNGKEEITYYDNSPDTLKRIILRLYPNIFRKGSARDYAINPEGVTDGVTIQNLVVGSEEIDLENRSRYRVVNTQATIYLTKYIPPNSAVKLEIEWSFYISPKSRLRVGIYDPTTMFIGLWYPQIAVYDDIDGWDNYNYSGQVEFYNDFSSYDVRITLPNNFGVWATGELVNPEEVLSEKTYKNYLEAEGSDTVIRIITKSNVENSVKVFNDEEDQNTWHFKADNVSDFAFALSDHYLWDGLSVIRDSSQNKRVFVHAVYPIDSPDFYEVAEVSKELVKYFTYEMPGITFPFPSFVAFNNGGSNGGGMEFPMIINDGSTDLYENTVALTAHEMTHQYFPFFVGTNEKKYAFMDEGFAVMLPFKHMENVASFNARLVRNIVSYQLLAGTEDDIPPMITSFSQTYTAYRNSAYDKSSIAYEILRDMLGNELFLKSIQKFIIRWNGKHPTPYDLFFTFNEVSGKNLNWFWKPWFFDQGFPDLAFDKVSVKEDKAEIIIKNNGTVPVRVKLELIYEDETSETYYFKTDVWKESNKTFSTEIELTGILKKIKLGDMYIPDSESENNIFLVH